ncbi:MAG: MerR family transcriptional regulator [Acidimicrobiales bacterium]|nr:MerR family transcriptional regulator [Acidimicrobiales bacterium]MCO5332353.1 MerR family transcriptional regulator [Ilumatobacteraceae bacterium]
MSDPFLRIGPFSRASSLSVKALRAYHEQGLLVPALVDPDTGYRVYGAEQLFDAAVLRRLRDLDVPLRQVHEVLSARDPAVTERVLAEHARIMQSRLADTLRIIAELQRGLDAPSVHTPVHVRVVPAEHALVVRSQVRVDDFGDFLGEAFERLFAVAARHGIRPTGAPGGLYPQQIDDDGVEQATAFVPIDRAVAIDDPVVALGEVPAGPVAVAVHVGTYDDVGDTYRLLGRWVAMHTTPAGRPVCERYLVGPPAPVEEYRTEIQWPVTGHVHDRSTP